MISRGDLGQHRPEEFSSRSWIRRGAISCSSHTSFDEIVDSVVNAELLPERSPMDPIW